MTDQPENHNHYYINDHGERVETVVVGLCDECNDPFQGLTAAQAVALLVFISTSNNQVDWLRENRVNSW